MRQRRKTLPVTQTDESSLAQRFDLVNRARLERVYHGLSERHRNFLDLAPLLFHVNHPALPGYVSTDTASGIFNYIPTAKAIAAARRLSKTFNSHQRALPHHTLYGLYLIGSVGTIGQSRGSDFDLWVCHRDGLDENQLDELHDKAQQLERYADEIGIEVHFFVFTPTTFRMGESLSLSAESSGSSQHYLLLDEFYRSGLVLAGVNPLWWYIPIDKETEYASHKTEVLKKEELHEFDFVDFGGLTHVPVDEFFGAALWQLSKSIDTPYKSVLKLVLMESYAAEYPHTTLLSHRYKNLIDQGVLDLEQLDPYILMYRQAENYLLKTQDEERLEVLRCSLYHKVNQPLSLPVRSVSREWQRSTMQQLVGEWGWSQAKIRELDQRDAWPIERVAKERRSLVNCFRKSYHILSEVARNNAGTRITREDLTVLGRKLYAAFERKTDKVEILNHGIASSGYEVRLEVRVSLAKDNAVWELLRPDRSDQDPILKQANSLASLIAWSSFNRIASRQTRWQLDAGSSSASDRDLKFVQEAIFDAFEKTLEKKTKVSAYSRPARIEKCLCMINVGIDPLDEHMASGQVLTSTNTDAFSFGGINKNLIQRIDLIVRTTWGEYYCQHFVGDSSVVSAIALLAKWAFAASGENIIDVRSAPSVYQGFVSHRVRQYLITALNFLGQRKEGESRTYLTSIDNHVYAVSRFDGGTKYRAMRTVYEFDSYCDELPEDIVKTEFDSTYFENHPVAIALSRNTPGTWQLFAIDRESFCDILVLDEFGRLSCRRGVTEPVAAVTSHYLRFLGSVLNRRRNDFEGISADSEVQRIEYFTLNKQKDSTWRLSRAKSNDQLPGTFLEITVTGHVSNANLTEVILSCGGREYSSFHHGVDMYKAVATDVLTQRAEPILYPVMVTDVDIAESDDGDGAARPPSLSRLLGYKAAVETKLSRAIMDVSRI